MVKFTENSFIVEVETGLNPIEAWLETHEQMCDLLQSENEQMLGYRYYYLELLRSMMPDWQTAKKMME